MSSMALRAGPQCVWRSQRCLIVGPRTDMIFERRLSALAFSDPPEVTAEIQTHTPTPSAESVTPLQDHRGTFCSGRSVDTYVHMQAHAQVPLATIRSCALIH